MNFYHTFLRLCNDVGKSPSKVILEIGGTKSAITRWKNGSNPTDATAQKIANYFGVPFDVLKYGLSEQEVAVIDALENGAFKDTKKTPTPKSERDMENEEIIQRLEEADEATRTVVLRLLGLQ